MNILSRFKNVYQIGLAFGVFAIAMVGVSTIANHTAVKAASTCASINVIYCGLSGSTTQAQIDSLKSYYDNNTSNTSGSPVFHDIQAIYNTVGANKTLIDGMNTTNTVPGLVWRDGSVTINTSLGLQVIGTHAMSTGRFWTTNSVAIDSSAYVRPTTDSFADPYLPAIIRLDNNGNIIFGAMIPCGNAFNATPQAIVKPPVVTTTVTPPAPKPDYTVVKLVANKNDMIFAPSITVNYGTHVVYNITVTSTGTAPVTSLGVYDTLPASVQYVNYTIKHDGAGYATSFFSSGIRISSLANGTSTNFTYEVIVGPNDTATSCKPEAILNTATTSIMAVMQTAKSSTATVNKTCNAPVVVTPPPVVKSVVVTSTYTPPPAPVVVATVTPPATPTVTATCTNLTLLTSALNQRLVTASVAYTASTGVALTNVKFDWNDNYLTNNGVATSAQHTYAAIGTYIITASLSFSNGSTALPVSSCQASVTFSAVAPPVITPIVPTVLPNTGPGSTFAIFAGVSVIGTLGYRLFLGRRLTGSIFG